MPALGAIAGVDAIFIALVAAILLYATYQLFSPLITGALSNIPLIGPSVARAVGSLLAVTWGAAASWSEAGVGSLITLIQHAALIPLYAIGDTLGTIHSIQNALTRLGFQWLPAFASSLHAYADQQAGAVQSWANATFAEFSQVYNAAIAQEHAWANATFAVFSNFYNAAIAQEHSWANATFAVFSNFYNAAIATEHAWAADTFSVFSQYYNQAIAQLQGLIDADAAQLQRTIEGEVQTLTQDIDATATQTLEQAIAHDNAIAAALSVAIAGVASAVQDIEDSPCMQVCPTLGGLGSELEAIDLTLIIAMALEAWQNPQAATQMVQDVVVPIVQDAGATAQDLLGIHPGATA